MKLKICMEELLEEARMHFANEQLTLNDLNIWRDENHLPAEKESKYLSSVIRRYIWINPTLDGRR
jgi:hypothetical protein